MYALANFSYIVSSERFVITETCTHYITMYFDKHLHRKPMHTSRNIKEEGMREGKIREDDNKGKKLH